MVIWSFDPICIYDDQRSKVFVFDQTSAEMDSIYVCKRTKKPSPAIVSFPYRKLFMKKETHTTYWNILCLYDLFSLHTVHLYLINVYPVCIAVQGETEECTRTVMHRECALKALVCHFFYRPRKAEWLCQHRFSVRTVRQYEHNFLQRIRPSQREWVQRDNMSKAHFVFMFWMRSSRVVRTSAWLSMPKSQQSWVRSQHAPTQWNLRGGADEAVVNNIHKNKKIHKYPPLNVEGRVYFGVIQTVNSWKFEE